MSDGWAVTLSNIEDCEIKLFDAMDYFNAPANETFVAGKLAQLRAVMARSKESNDDISLVIATYGEHLRSYPADIVAYVIDNTIRNKKWFPLVSELVGEVERLTRLRKTILRRFEECRRLALADKVRAISATA